MRFFFISWMLNIKKLASKRTFMLAMCLLPACALLCAWPAAGAGGQALRVSVGLCYNEEDEASRRVLAHLSQGSGVGLSVFGADEAGELERAVTKGELECGYVLDPALGARFAGGGADWMNGVVTVVKTRATVADAVVNERVYAALIAAASPYVTARALEEGMGADYEDVLGPVSESVARYATQDIFVTPEYAYEEGGLAETPRGRSPFFGRALRGMIALFGVASVLLACPAFIAERQGRVFTRLPFGRLCAYNASAFAALFTLNAAFGLAGLAVLRLVYPPAVPDFLAAAPALCLYEANLAMIGVFFICLLNSGELITGSFVLILLMNLLFGGVLLDLNEVSSLLGAVSRLFPSYYYLRGDAAGLAVLAGLTAAFAAAAAAALAGRRALGNS